jgi:hypothetical protein
VLWRQHGRHRSLTFENLPAAERFKTLLEDHGPDEALRIIELDEIGRHVPTVTEWLYTHIDNLTGVQPATLGRYRTYVDRRGRSDAPIHDLGTSPLGKDLKHFVEVNGVSHEMFFVVDVLTPKSRRSRSIFRVDEVY